MPLLCSPQHHYLTFYGLPAHDVLSIECQLMMELHVKASTGLDSTTCTKGELVASTLKE